MKKTRVVCVGDSHTLGRSASSYVEILARSMAAFEWINAGANRDLAYNVLQRLDTIIARQPDRVVVLVGSNDANASLAEAGARRAVKRMDLPCPPDAASFRENLLKIVVRLQAETDASIALLSLPPIGEDLGHPSVHRAAAYSRIVREVGRQTGAAYLPLNETLMERLRRNPSAPRFSYRWWRVCVYMARFQQAVLRMRLDAIGRWNGFRSWWTSSI